jgi:uncharacterized membrane protein
MREVISWLQHRFGLLVQWGAFVAGMSLVIHGLVILAAPQFSSQIAMNELKKLGPINSAVSLSPYERTVLSGQFPDTVVTNDVCIFNLSQGPLDLKAHLPKGQWSLALYSDNRQLIYAATESDNDGTEFRAILAGTGQQFDNPQEIDEIRVAQFTGLVVFRRFTADNEGPVALSCQAYLPSPSSLRPFEPLTGTK